MTNATDPAAVQAACERLQAYCSQFHVHPKHPDWGMVIGPEDVEALRLVLAALSARDEARQNLEAVAREVCAALKADDLRLMINRTKALGVVLSALPKQALAAQLPGTTGKQEAEVAGEGEMKEAGEG